MKRYIRLPYITAIFTAILCLGVFAGVAAAVEVLQNTSFENYDAGTLVPDNWQVLDGSVQVYAEDAFDGAVSAYSLGGTAQEVEGEWVLTPQTTQGGTLVQLIDLSTLPDYSSANWLAMRMVMNNHLWSGTSITMVLEYLPADYDSMTVTADDTAWSGPDAATALTYSYTYTRTTWRAQTRNTTIPKVRWARARFVFDVHFSEDSDFTGGPYYIALDAVSVDAEAIVPEPPCSDNVLANPGFESASGGVPADWYVLSGRMSAIDNLPVLPAYSGAGYAGNIGGYLDEGVDYPDPPQNGSLVQLVDLSTLSNWSEAGFITFSFSGFHMKNGINDMSYTVEY
nr:hypothetical protein [Desulfobacterales bacterium]